MLDSATIEAFQRDGVVVLKGAADAHWLERLREAVEQNIAAPGPFGKVYTPEGADGFYFGDYCNWDRIDGYRAFARESGIAEKVAALFGSRRINLFHEHVLVKDPGTQTATPWHHDQPYWTVDGDQVGSTWIALDPVPVDVTMSFVAGSHLSGVHYRPRYFSNESDYEDHDGPSVPDLDADPDAYRILRFAVAPGDAIAFHPRPLHRAPGHTAHPPPRAPNVRAAGVFAVYCVFVPGRRRRGGPGGQPPTRQHPNRAAATKCVAHGPC